MEELCKTVGEIKDLIIVCGRSGLKSAEIVFARRSDALTCVSKYNGAVLSDYF
jgi:hypothetical protein